MSGRIFGKGYAVGEGRAGDDGACAVSEEGVGFISESIVGWECCGGRKQSGRCWEGGGGGFHMSCKSFRGQHLRSVPGRWCGYEVLVGWAEAEVGCCLYPRVFEIGLAVNDC